MIARLCAVLADRNDVTEPERFEADVTALLMAMEQPTPGMLAAVTYDDGEMFFDAESATLVWQKMLKAILPPSSEGREG